MQFFLDQYSLLIITLLTKMKTSIQGHKYSIWLFCVPIFCSTVPTFWFMPLEVHNTEELVFFYGKVLRSKLVTSFPEKRFMNYKMKEFTQSMHHLWIRCKILFKAVELHNTFVYQARLFYFNDLTYFSEILLCL